MVRLDDLLVLVRDARRLDASDAARSPLGTWSTSLGDGFDVGGVRDALAEAERALRQPEAAGESRTVPQVPVAAAIYRTLPEAVIRLRASLAGHAPLPSLSPVVPPLVDRDALLAGAFDLLGRLRRRLGHLGCQVPSITDAQPIGAAPAATRYAWPPDIQTDVLLFEALLGAAWQSPLPGNRSFPWRPVVPRETAVPDTPRTPLEAVLAPSAMAAWAVLALEWVLCTTDLRWPNGDWELLAEWLGGFDTPTDATTAAHVPNDEGASLVLEARSDSGSSSVELPLDLVLTALARFLTGSGRVVAQGRSTAEGWRPTLSLVGTGESRLSIFLAGPSSTVHTGLEASAFVRTLRATPRVLTEEGMPQSTVAYQTADGVVCAAVHRNESLLIRPDGSIREHRRWPRPIVGEIPMGPSGAVAWSNTSNVGRDALGYVLYRGSDAADTIVEELPFKPTAGTWWQRQLYWKCFPTGLGRWAPGDQPALLFPDVPLFAVLEDHDALLLEPCVRDDQGRALRRLITQGLRWNGSGEPERAPLSPLGPASAACRGEAWTATAYPEADRIRLVSNAGAVITLNCYYPVAVAWAGRSLVVSTMDLDVLFWRDLADLLDRVAEPAERKGSSR